MKFIVFSLCLICFVLTEISAQKLYVKTLILRIDSLNKAEQWEQSVEQSTILLTKDETENSDSLRVFCQLNFANAFWKLNKIDLAQSYLDFVFNHYSTFSEEEQSQQGQLIIAAWCLQSHLFLQQKDKTKAEIYWNLIQKNCHWAEKDSYSNSKIEELRLKIQE
ncbi:MAG: hypothetical protein EAZ57_11235 [Cytophagales bacterium]|nr:MAG: hypothetical protein EAZ67_11895 [Cytophagales bacterium]TAF59447.1 MAG: hypothetical protein EAZ57_11235 [Cytophagales bacterium]